MTILVFIFRRNGYRHPTSLPLLWLCSLFVGTVDLYQIFNVNLRTIDIFDAVLKCLQVLFVIKALIISCLTPRLSVFQMLDNDSSLECPMTDFNVFQRLGFLWLNKVLKYGYKSEEYLGNYLLPSCHYLKTKSASDAFESADKKYNKNTVQESKRLLILLWSTAWIPYTAEIVMEFGGIASNFSQPFFLSKLLDFVSGVDQHMWHGVCYAIAYCLLNQAHSFFDCHGYQFCVLVAFRVRMALTNAIYKKMLRLSAGARREYTTGWLNYH